MNYLSSFLKCTDIRLENFVEYKNKTAAKHKEWAGCRQYAGCRPL